MEGCILSSQQSDFNIFRVNLITDATAIPLGWLLYASDDAWAEDARDLLTELAAYLLQHAHIIVLGDRIHTGEPNLSRLDELHWDYIFRAPSDTLGDVAAGSGARTHPKMQADHDEAAAVPEKQYQARDRCLYQRQ